MYGIITILNPLFLIILKKSSINQKKMEEQTPIQQTPTSALLTEFSTRLNEIEEKQRLIKDRVLLIGENLISTKEELDKETSEFKNQIKQIDFELKSLKQLVERITNELGNFARKSELEILDRQIKMFKPLKPVRTEDVKRIVREEMRRIKSIK